MISAAARAARSLGTGSGQRSQQFRDQPLQGGSTGRGQSKEFLAWRVGCQLLYIILEFLGLNVRQRALWCHVTSSILLNFAGT